MTLSYIIVKPDELYHARSHKYISKKWRNGRWRYYYSANDKNGQSPSQAKTSITDAGDAYKMMLDKANRGTVTLVPGGKEMLLRNMAAYRQELDRINAFERESKSFNSVLRTTVDSISTAIGSAYDKGKKWLSGIFSTKETLSTLDGYKIGERIVNGWTKKPSEAMKYNPPKRK